ncbi:MAG: type II toxin-antitoxin system HicB family antitoxin [Prolixibacteraceae bacterium]|nr:type II toxin-antitoxin system HicB family antitoxin [Prolixibacteraceae bacterium]
MKKVKVKISWLDNYGAYSDDIPGCIATHKTLEGVKEAFNSALQFHIEGMVENGEELPKCLKGDYELVFELNAQALLHHFEGILTRSALSRVTGINERQLGHYATGHRTPRPAQRNKIIEGIRKIGKEFISVK